MTPPLANASIVSREVGTGGATEAETYPITDARLSVAPVLPVGPTLRIQLLGRYVVSGLHGVGLGDTESRTHVRALLALAAASPQGVGRDEAIDVLWPRHADTAARNRLYHTMHLVRRALGALAWHDDWITLSQGRVQLDPRVACDAARLHAAAAGPLDRLGNADLIEIIDTCRGEWAPDVDAGGLGHTIRRHLHDCHAALVHEAADRLTGAGDTPARREMLARALRLSATDEWACLQLMQLDLAAQRPHAVLRSFELASRELVQQLGLRPSTALSEFASVAASRLASGQAAEPGLVQTALVGREALVRELTTELNAHPGVWNLSGLSGVGKTALVREIARRAGPLRAEGLRFIALGDHAIDEAAVPAVLRASGFIHDPAADDDDTLRKLLGTRDVLLVVDDLEAAPQWQRLVALLDGVLAARVVLVTHTPIDHASARHVLVPPLATPGDAEPMAEALLSPSVALFQMRQAAVSGQPGSETHWREVVELVRRLDGLPLAIELASARTATMTPGEILRQLDQGGLPHSNLPTSVAHPGANACNRHLSVAAALDVTVELLHPDSRRAYCAAAAFSGSFAAAEFGAVAHAAGVLPPPLGGSPDTPLDALVAAGVLTRSDTGVLRMLHLPRAHARALAQAEGLWQRIERARIDQVIAALAVGETHHESPGYTAWMHTVLTLHDSALSVLGTAQRDDDARFLRLLVPLAQSWALRRQRNVPFIWFEQGLGAARRLGDSRGEMMILLATTNTLLAVKRVDEALAHTETAMRLVATSHDAVVTAMTVTMRAHALSANGQRREAIDLLEDWIVRMPFATAGHATLASALIFNKCPVSGVTPTQGDCEWADSATLRARLAGSLAWRNVLLAVDDCITTLSPQAHLLIADELSLIAREMHTPWLGQHAQHRRAIALLSLERADEAATAAREWHRLASGVGLETSLGMACLFLAELAWRAGDTEVARHWLADVPAMTMGGLHEDRVLCASAAMQATVAAIDGDHGTSANHFLRLSRVALAELQWPNLERVVECAALVAKGAGHAALHRSLADALAVIADPNERVPSVERFRARYFGLSGAAPDSSDIDIDIDSVEAANARSRNDLCTLFDLLSATRIR